MTAYRLLAPLIAALTTAAAPALAADLPQAHDVYFARSEARLAEIAAQKAPPRRAKNVILFIGDGMGLTTVTAARILQAQMQGRDGESSQLTFERFPYVALSKTYSHDNQVTDSAAGITGLVTGVKTRNDVVGLDGRALLNDCASAKGREVASIHEIAKRAGLATGVVTTTSLTDATPAGTYGHAPQRDWEDDASTPAEAQALGCRDLARQFAEQPADVRLDVAMGGGAWRFTPVDKGGRRKDGRDLLAEWRAANPGGVVVTDAAGLAAAAKAPKILGVFAPNHMAFKLDAPETQPTLTQMATAAVDVLSRNPKGYVLLVEGGLGDKAMHVNNGARALTEIVEFDAAIAAVLAKVDLNETLVIVTADHSHGLVMSGGSERNAPILGLAQKGGKPAPTTDGVPYTTLSFATGPGFRPGPRTAVTQAEAQDKDFKQPALAPMSSAQHGGEDVGIFATGPGSDLVRGVVEEPYVFQVMRHALGLDAK